MKPGPRTRAQLTRLAREWKQGEHVILTGSTGSGKTALARNLDQIRIDRGGHVVVFVAKFNGDDTIASDYQGWTRWKKWKKNPSRSDNRILLWPDTSKARGNEKLDIQREVFKHALKELTEVGKWTVHIDEGLYMADPTFMNLGKDLSRNLIMGRSDRLTMMVLAQRPAHLPLVCYSSASHAFMGRAREQTDLKRLSELGGRASAKELQGRIDSQGKHDFLWVPVDQERDPEVINLRY